MIELLQRLNSHLPGGLQRALLIRRRARLWLGAGIVFVHVPKAAGTSINEALYGRFMGHPRAAEIRRWAPAAVNALPSFSVTRNPWDRLVSAWRFARAGAGVGETYRAGMKRPEQYRVPEFDTFERFVKEWLVPRDVTRIDGVFQPQWLFLCDRERNLLVDHVGRVEDLAPTLAFIRENTGRAVDLAQANRSGEAVDFRAFYTPELTKLIGNIYAADIDLFGYRFDA